METLIMITNMYTIYDSKAETYSKPFHMLNDSLALRSCTDLANDPNSELNRHPEDFTLFLIGEWDDNSCEFEIRESPKSILRFHELATVTNIKEA